MIGETIIASINESIMRSELIRLTGSRDFYSEIFTQVDCGLTLSGFIYSNARRFNSLKYS